LLRNLWRNGHALSGSRDDLLGFCIEQTNVRHGHILAVNLGRFYGSASPRFLSLLCDSSCPNLALIAKVRSQDLSSQRRRHISVGDFVWPQTRFDPIPPLLVAVEVVAASLRE